MSNGININYGSLQLSTPAIVVPINSQIGAMSTAVTQSMQSAEGDYSGINSQAAYATSDALMQNNANYSAQQAASNSAFNNTASQVAEYQANAIGHQGKK
jgi:hypothetical protein